MNYGIIDSNFANRLTQDLREADWQEKHGSAELAAHLRQQYQETVKLDEEIRCMQYKQERAVE